MELLAELDPVVMIAVLSAVILFSFLLLLAKRYRRCPSNNVLVVYGKVAGNEAAKCIHGGGAFVWPLIQDYAYLDLEPLQIEIPLTPPRHGPDRPIRERKKESIAVKELSSFWILDFGFTI